MRFQGVLVLAMLQIMGLTLIYILSSERIYFSSTFCLPLRQFWWLSDTLTGGY